MKTRRILSAAMAAAMVIASIPTLMPRIIVHADNPLAQMLYTADPAPMVYDGRLYLYTSHDKDNSDYFYMPDWQCYSTTDMQNWTHHGTVMSDTDFAFAEKDTAWATQCVERNGKFYLYCPLSNASGGGRVIGVGVSDSPTGPFVDAIGKPLVGPNWDYIDPTVFIDDDGQAYLYFGNPQLYYVKLNEDMISYSGEIQKVDMNPEGFGSGEGANDRTGTIYTEGPWFYRRGSLYYMLYAAAGIPECIAYSTSTSPTGPWSYRGVIMPKGEQGAAFTNHCGVCDYKGHSYFFYHNQRLPGGGGFDRSVAVEEFTYNSDGTFPTIQMTNDGPEQLEALNPYVRVEAETICWESGIETEVCSAGGMNVANIENGDYVKVSGVDFGDGATGFTASVASAQNGGKIEIHLDQPDGPLVGTCAVAGTGGWQTWQEVSCDISGASNVHDVFFQYTGGSGFLFNVDWWQFSGNAAEPDAQGYFFHDTFETGSSQWNGRGAATVSAVDTVCYEGSKSLQCVDRTAAWNGAARTLSSTAFQAGETYAFSVHVMGADSNTLERFYLTLQYQGTDGETHYDKIASGFALGGNWIQLANLNYTIPKGASDLIMYVETESGSDSFYLDEAIGAVAGSAISGAGMEHAAILGDVNDNGRIDAGDLSLAKRMLLTDTTPSAWTVTMADVDRNGTVTIADVLWLQKYVLGIETAYPEQAEPIAPPPSDYEYDPMPQYKEVPSNYYTVPSTAGKVTTETYSGINGQKQLLVYTPAGYDASKQYNIFYLMHGGGEKETTIFSDDVKMKAILDNMIQDGVIEPMIVVCPTFNGGNCSAENFFHEFRESVVPFVEGKYSTYAKSTASADLEASRMHRAFGGFSMGGGCTWNVLLNDIDIVAYFMPLSGHCWGGAAAVAQAIENSKYKNATYIFAATGTDDIAYGNLNPQIEAMKGMSTFRYTADFSQGNLYFLVGPEKTHWWGFVRHYVYVGLPYFFHEGQ